MVRLNIYKSVLFIKELGQWAQQIKTELMIRHEPATYN